MISIRDILKYFSLDVCSKLDVIEQYKNKKRSQNSLPFALKFVCISSVFVICSLLIGLLLVLAMGYDYSLDWLALFGCILVGCTYFLRKKQEFIVQYIKILMLIFGFLCFVLGMDMLMADGNFLILGLVSFMFFAVTYNFFNNEIYHFFATVFICVIFSIYSYGQGNEMLQICLMIMTLLVVLIALFPLKYVNLYPLSKAIIVYIGISLLFLHLNQNFYEQDIVLKYFMSFIVFCLGCICALYKDKKEIIPITIFAVFLFISSLFSFYGVGFASIVLLLGYMLSSVAMFIFGVIFYILYATIFYIELESLLYNKAIILFSISIIGFGIAFLLGRMQNAKK